MILSNALTRDLKDLIKKHSDLVAELSSEIGVDFTAKMIDAFGNQCLRHEHSDATIRVLHSLLSESGIYLCKQITELQEVRENARNTEVGKQDSNEVSKLDGSVSDGGNEPAGE